MRVALTALAFLMSACAPGDGRPISETPQHWNLPTGSTIAYLRAPARGAARVAAPIVVLHGGPGAYVVSLDETTRVLARLSETGRDVYFYDQVGGGLSERLTDIAEYTVDRHIADLEAIRVQIGAERIVLLGSSWGATLAVHYTARYPERVESLILSGPGVIHPSDWPEGYGRVEERFTSEEAERFQTAVNSPRLEEALEAWSEDPNAGPRLFSDDEAGAFFDRIANDFYLPHLGCEGAPLNTMSRGYGFWSNRMTGRDLNVSADPKPMLSQLDTPVLILRGECEYMRRAVAEQYDRVFSNSTLEDIEGAGHMIYWEQPEVFLARVTAFLARTP